jgi:hypothetical protein
MNDLENLFRYHPPGSDEVKTAHETVRDAAWQFAQTLTTTVPGSDELEAAIYHVRQAMWAANAAIACHHPDND